MVVAIEGWRWWLWWGCIGSSDCANDSDGIIIEVVVTTDNDGTRWEGDSGWKPDKRFRYRTISDREIAV